ncbi:TIGR04282 family arsenosugar biosynthesis glycosyltransferase [Phreatobacter cathodiphilus]|uniref:Glycosyltransferase n=1 Tax=Phreatobacter cathodiphilus TaxID=1868589 RepID=A0A2S0NGN3_9HYPH|nr:DUF2064 domain-containing protein [Phreatobacter cathodiphilus]AVO47237.1 hypothetical protein C6569_20530 [Phreatobacter cathodiphilus]
MTKRTIGLGLMAKPPRPGIAKTRLAAAIGAAAAADLAAAFLMDGAAIAAAAAGPADLCCEVFYRPADGAAEIAALVGQDWPMVFCDRGELGATMWDVLFRLLARHPAGAMVMGADLPLVPPAVLGEAAEVLRRGGERAVVVMPSADGGYGLIGVRSALAAPLFAPMAWSTAGVLAETLRRAGAEGLTVHLLPEQHDVDEPEDLAWLRAALAAAPGAAPATRAALARLDGGAGG